MQLVRGEFWTDSPGKSGKFPSVVEKIRGWHIHGTEKAQAQEFIGNMNTMDKEIKWTTEGEVVKEIEGLQNRTERGLTFLDTPVSDKWRWDN